MSMLHVSCYNVMDSLQAQVTVFRQTETAQGWTQLGQGLLLHGHAREASTGEVLSEMGLWLTRRAVQLLEHPWGAEEF